MDKSPDGTISRPTRILAVIVQLWVPLVALFYLWQVRWGSGLFGYLTEAQFARIGHSYGALTYGLLLLVTALPPAIAFTIWRKHKRGVSKKDLTVAHQLTDARYFIRWLLVLTITLIGVSLIVAIPTLFNWSDDSSAPISLSAGNVAPPDSNRKNTVLTGYAVRSRAVGYTQKVGSADYTVHFIPVAESAGAVPAYRYFVQVPANGAVDTARDMNGRYTGILVQNMLPSPVFNLMVQRGTVITAPYYVLYADWDWNRWPRLGFALHMLFAGLAAGWIAYLQNKHVKRRIKIFEESDTNQAVAES